MKSTKNSQKLQQTQLTIKKAPTISQQSIKIKKNTTKSKISKVKTTTQPKISKAKTAPKDHNTVKINFGAIGKVCAVVFALLLIGVFFVNQASSRQQKQIDRAISYAEDEKYDKAIKILSKMGDYENASKLLLKYKFLDDSTYVTIGNGTTWSRFNGEESDEARDLEWKKVKVEGTKYLIVSRYFLGDEVFDHYKEDATWAECSLREWLDDYYNNHFTDVEKSIILTTNNYTPDYHDAETGSYTEDKLFLLSEAEYIEIGSIDMDSDYSSFWWLRINYSYDHPNYIVQRGKIEVDEKMACSGNTFVRAAMWVDIGLLDN